LLATSKPIQSVCTSPSIQITEALALAQPPQSLTIIPLSLPLSLPLLPRKRFHPSLTLPLCELRPCRRRTHAGFNALKRLGVNLRASTRTRARTRARTYTLLARAHELGHTRLRFEARLPLGVCSSLHRRLRSLSLSLLTSRCLLHGPYPLLHQSLLALAHWPLAYWPLPRLALLHGLVHAHELLGSLEDLLDLGRVHFRLR
jgi:hypothetical protein